MVRIHPDPPTNAGAVAQLGEHLLCKQGVVGSIPSSSTNVREAGRSGAGSTGTHRQAARTVCLWLSELLYRLFFNNAEEVKQILLEQRDGRLRAFRPAVTSGMG